MGFFSWVTSDTNRSICNAYSGKKTFPVYVLCPDGTVIKETNYLGYGEFGGHDIYALVAKWNVPEQCKDEQGEWLPDEQIRSYGIHIACYDQDNAELTYPIKLVENPNLSYESVAPSMSCRYQGYFYPDSKEDDVLFLI